LRQDANAADRSLVEARNIQVGVRGFAR
jgi:hypothetical protein